MDRSVWQLEWEGKVFAIYSRHLVFNKKYKMVLKDDIDHDIYYPDNLLGGMEVAAAFEFSLEKHGRVV